MNVIKRILNVWFNWFIVCWAQAFCIVYCMYCIAAKVVAGEWPVDSRKWVGMLLLGEEGIFSVAVPEEEE